MLSPAPETPTARIPGKSDQREKGRCFRSEANWMEREKGWCFRREANWMEREKGRCFRREASWMEMRLECSLAPRSVVAKGWMKVVRPGRWPPREVTPR